MATANPGTFVLEVAETGKSLMTSFTRFITYRKVTDRRFENLYATLSLTTNTLTEIGTNINKYYDEFPIKDEVSRPICETCRSNFNRFLVLIKEGTSSGVWKNDGTLGGEAFTTEMDPWFLITMSLGGRDEAKAFWKSLDNTRDAILELNDVVRYMILKDLNKKNKLSKEQVEEFKDVTALLPHLIQRLSKSEKAREADAAEAAREAARKAPPPPPPPFNRKDSDAASERTLIVEHKKNVKPPFAKDIDCQSVSSFSSSSSGSSSDDEPTEIYEEWLLRWNEPTRTVNRSRGIFGIRFKSYFEEEGFWGTDPEYRTQDELKEQEKFASADLSPAKHKEAMQKIIRSIPKEGGFSIDTLIEDRTEASTNEDAKRQWSVVAVRPKQKFPYAGSKKKWGKNPDFTDWLVTIKGETVDTKERSRSFRRDDPWRQRSRSPGSIRRGSSPRRYPGTRPRPRHRSRSPIRGGPPPPPPPFRQNIPPPPPPTFRDAVPDEGFRIGTLVIGKIPSPEEAEKKMEEIWTKMNEVKITEEDDSDEELLDD